MILKRRKLVKSCYSKRRLRWFQNPFGNQEYVKVKHAAHQCICAKRFFSQSAIWQRDGAFFFSYVVMFYIDSDSSFSKAQRETETKALDFRSVVNLLTYGIDINVKYHFCYFLCLKLNNCMYTAT